MKPYGVYAVPDTTVRGKKYMWYRLTFTCRTLTGKLESTTACARNVEQSLISQSLFGKV